MFAKSVVALKNRQRYKLTNLITNNSSKSFYDLIKKRI